VVEKKSIHTRQQGGWTPNGNGTRNPMPRHVPPEALSAVAESSDLETMRAVFGPLTSYLTVELARDILQHTGGKAYAVFDQSIPFDLADTLQSRARVLSKLRVVKPHFPHPLHSQLH
jgi:hypothetical protein